MLINCRKDSRKGRFLFSDYIYLNSVFGIKYLYLNVIFFYFLFYINLFLKVEENNVEIYKGSIIKLIRKVFLYLN